MLFDKIDITSSGKIGKASFVQFWKKEFINVDVTKRLFKVFAKNDMPDYLTPECFKPVMKALLESHPGLEFLQATPEF